MNNKKEMFDFALEQKKIWKESNDEVYRVAWETARHMIHIAGLWDEWTEYIKENGVLAEKKTC